MSKTILVIPDSHAMPGQDLSRYTAAGRLIVDRKPDYIVELGDFGDFESLCIHDGKGTMEAAALPRLLDDIEVAQEARRLLMQPYYDYRKNYLNVHKKAKTSGYIPQLYALEGNHEYRFRRFIEKNPKFARLVDHDITGILAHGWTPVPYEGLNPGILELEGMLYAHYFTSGAMGKPISGKYVGAALINKKHMSCTGGHGHRLLWHQELGIRTLSGLEAGWFGEAFMPYAGQANKEWWSGLTIQHITGPGEYDPEFISIQRVKEQYL